MAEQYFRKSQLYIGDDANGLNVSELRFSFTVKRGDSQTPNSADIRIYNMAPATVARIQKEFTRVVLTGGYDASYGTIFDGTVVQTRYGRISGVDTTLDITAADGDRAYNFAYVNTTLAAGSTAVDHFRVVAQAMEQHGVGVGYTAGLQSNSLPRGKVMFGMARDALACTARNTGTTWSIQDGKLQVVPETSYMPGEIAEISADTGLIGMPQQTESGVTLSTLMNPKLKIGTLIQLRNSSIQQYEFGLGKAAVKQREDIEKRNRLATNGLYYVMSAEHQGDTHENAWYTKLVCVAADPTVIASSDLLERTKFGAIGPVPNAIKSQG